MKRLDSRVLWLLGAWALLLAAPAQATNPVCARLSPTSPSYALYGCEQQESLDAAEVRLGEIETKLDQIAAGVASIDGAVGDLDLLAQTIAEDLVSLDQPAEPIQFAYSRNFLSDPATETELIPLIPAQAGKMLIVTCRYDYDLPLNPEFQFVADIDGNATRLLQIRNSSDAGIFTAIGRSFHIVALTRDMGRASFECSGIAVPST